MQVSSSKLEYLMQTLSLSFNCKCVICLPYSIHAIRRLNETHGGGLTKTIDVTDIEHSTERTTSKEEEKIGPLNFRCRSDIHFELVCYV